MLKKKEIDCSWTFAKKNRLDLVKKEPYNQASSLW
jgi:hypothetical protein